jgi:glycosyltransferase involved in cell wall biosynthesis
MQIATIFPTVPVNSFYRSLGPLTALAAQGHAVIMRPAVPSEIDVDELAQCDVLHVYRECGELVFNTVKVLQRAGVAVTYDQDDDWTATKPKRGDPKFFYLGGLQGQRLVSDSMRLARRADLMTTTSEALAQRYRDGGVERTAVIENYLVMPPVPSPPRNGEAVRIGWIAGGEHVMERDGLQLPEIFMRLLDAHPNVTVETIGVSLELTHPRYVHREWEPFMSMFERLATFDVGIAPLVDCQFNQARSNIKLKEYAACGVPWLASQFGAYAEFGEAEGGRLVADDGWHEALEQLVCDPAERERLAQNAKQWGARQTVNLHVDRWEDAFNRAIDHVQAQNAKTVRRR